MLEGYLTSKDLAKRQGWKRVETVYEYLARGELPEPDLRIGRGLAWKVETIEKWEQGRPGQDWRKSETDRE